MYVFTNNWRAYFVAALRLLFPPWRIAEHGIKACLPKFHYCNVRFDKQFRSAVTSGKIRYRSTCRYHAAIILQRDMSRAAVLFWACDCASFEDSTVHAHPGAKIWAPTGIPSTPLPLLPARSSVQLCWVGKGAAKSPLKSFWKTLRISETMTELLAFLRAHGRERQRAGALTFGLAWAHTE